MKSCFLDEANFFPPQLMKVFILHSSADPTSKTMAELTLDSAIYNTGYEPFLVNVLDESSGKDFLSNNNIQLQNGLVQPSPDAISSAASHMALWNHCAKTDEAIIVAEHSTLFVRNWENPKFEDVLHLNSYNAFTRSNLQGEVSKVGDYSSMIENHVSRMGFGSPELHGTISMNGVFAYAIQPHAAKKLINHVSVNGYSYGDKLMSQPAISIETIHPPIAHEQVPSIWRKKFE